MSLKSQPKAIPVKIHLHPFFAALLKKKANEHEKTIGQVVETLLERPVMFSPEIYASLIEESDLRHMKIEDIVEQALRSRIWFIQRPNKEPPK